MVGAGFVAAQLGDVDADAVGEDLLGEAGVLAGVGEGASRGDRSRVEPAGDGMRLPSLTT